MSLIADFVVYTHSALLPRPCGQTFYVGMGSRQRAYRKSRQDRSSAWHNEVLLYGGYTVEIVSSGLTQEEAWEQEKLLINKLGWRPPNNQLINKSPGGDGAACGEANPAARSVTCLDTGKVFDTVRDAAKAVIKKQEKGNLNSIACGISRVCSGDNFSSGGWRWKWTLQDTQQCARKSLFRKVKCITNGMLFESATAAAEWALQEGLSTNREAARSSITKTCKNKYETALKLKWEYAQ